MNARYPQSPQDVYAWVKEGYTGIISYAKLSGYERSDYPGLSRVKNSQGNWVNLIIPPPDAAWARQEQPWDAIIDSLKDDTQDWLGTGWTLTRNSGWIFLTPSGLQKKYAIKHPGHPDFMWWFTQFASRHPDIMDAVDELPMEFHLYEQPEVLPEGPEDVPHPSVSSTVDLGPILTRLDEMEAQLEEIHNMIYNIGMTLGV